MISKRAVIALLLAYLTVSAAAESSLRGKVTASGLPVPGVRVEVVSATGGRTLVEWSGAEGEFRLTGLHEGETVQVSAGATGFVLSQRPVTLTAGENTADFTLALVNVRESVVVTEGLLSVRSDAPEKSQTVSTEQLQELPSNGRRLMRFSLLSPHVRQGIGLGGDGNDSNRLSINASSYRHTAYMLDGAVNYDWIYANGPQQPVSVSAVEQMRIVSGQYAAEFGTSTAGVLIVTTRSGGNAHHGEALALLRPSGLQAQAPLTAAALPRIPNERWQWGASAGGRIRRDRTFYFVNYEGALQARGSFIQSPRPSFFTGTQQEQYALAKLDHRWNDANWMTWRSNGYVYLGNNVNDRVGGFNQPSFGRETRTQSWGSQLNLYALQGPALNELRLSMVAYFPDSAFPLQSSVQIGRPSYSVEGFSTNNWVHAQTYSLADVIAVRLGAHQLKAGGEYVRQKVKDYSYTPFGTYTFAAGASQPGQQPLRFSQTFGFANFRYGQTVASGFVQDDWKVTRRLTLNAGLRYEIQSVTQDRNNFAPRVGLAWDVTGDGRNVLRAGAGMFYDQYYLYIYRRFYSLSPFAPTATYTIPFGDPSFPEFPGSLTAPPLAGSAARDIYIPANRLLNPYSLQYSLAYEGQLGKGFVLTVDGLHSHVLKQMRVNDVNHPAAFTRTAPGQVRSAAAADSTRPYRTWNGVPVRLIAQIENSSSSIYDALSVGVSRRMSRRFFVDAHYTASSSATYSAFYSDANSGIPNEWNDWGPAERAPSDFFQRHRFTSSSMLELPLRLKWSTVAIVGSGLPVNPLTGTDNNGDTYSSDRPVGFGRNSFRTPMQTQFDMAVSRRVRVTERVTAELRTEVFNVINRNNYLEVNNIYGEGPAPRSTFLSPVAGVTRTDPSRQIQFGLRLLF
jgi:hypothetical protein